ncbi:DUF6282 family protein [Winslowiella iniecta]|uniref:Amidohydrolase-related domain-containing protein n=1 Tax=Winslowiella iniecta TaxID=1560201 RepID=A0A0L7T0H3_9GAMM|nr:DUF6282 family protein [Winslowiella iniecta]KOC88721.1 hypothetical protein NG42_14970 [Winslowiella iniecta]KOC90957.1 hypothetical protein NG43_16160 [Winslowiella iniecta]
MNNEFIAYWRSKISFLDVHYHVSPDTFIRRHNVISAGEIYKSLGGAVVLKNHLGDSVALAETARLCGLPVMGSVVLNQVAGGPNWKSVEESLCKRQSAHSGRMIIHLPTVTAVHNKNKVDRTLSNQYCADARAQGVSISDESGALRKEVIEILHMARDNPVVISSGHTSRSETLTLIEMADKIGVPRLMLNQPANPMTGLSSKDLANLAGAEWLFIEQTALTYLLGWQTWEDYSQVLGEIPNVVYSSDLGQTSQPDLPEWHRQSLAWFDEMGLSSARRDAIWLDNPLKMLAP